MRLVAHSNQAKCPVRRFEATAAGTADGMLELSYHLEADLAGVRVPAPTMRQAADGLWRHTCFEAFIAPAGAPGYCEFNFSPSGEWAAYGFTGYRAGMAPLAAVAIAAVNWRRASGCLELGVVLRPGVFLPATAASLQVGLAAVIEEQSGTISHWALRHPPGAPDFHHRAGFALELPRATAPGAAQS